MLRILAALLVAFGSPLCCCQAGMIAGAAVCMPEVAAGVAGPIRSCCGGCAAEREGREGREGRDATPAETGEGHPMPCESCSACEGTAAGSGVPSTVKLNVDVPMVDVIATSLLADVWHPLIWLSGRAVVQAEAGEDLLSESGRAVLRWHCALIV